MKVPKDYDFQAKGGISFNKGTNSNDNPGIQPHESAIKDCPGENASNETKEHRISKGQPFGKGGAGYTSNY